MKQFIVPQFIDVEDKILGPITVRQFVLIVVGGIIEFLSFRFGDLGFFIVMTIIILALVGLFGFVKINGAPFHYFLLNIAASFKKPALRVWNKNFREEVLLEAKTEAPKKNYKPKSPLSTSRLSELSLIVDTHGKYKGEE